MEIGNIWIINLKKDTNKRVQIQNEINKLPSYLQNKNIIFDAVDGNNDLNNHEFNIVNEWREPFTRKQITHGEIGCALSHWNIWKHIHSANDNKYHIVLEDDVCFPNIELFVKQLNAIIMYLNTSEQNIDFIYFNRKPFDTTNESIVYKNTSENIQLVKCNYSYWTCAYLVTPTGVNKFINSQFNLNIIPVDEFIPIMYGQSSLYGQYSKYYNNAGQLYALATHKVIVPLNNNAFKYSSTVMSEPYLTYTINNNDNKINNMLTIYGIGSAATNGRQRFCQFCDIYGLQYQIIGDGIEWKTNMAEGPGGGQKVNILKQKLYDEFINDRINNDLIIVSDTYDVICLAGNNDIINAYNNISQKHGFNNYKNVVVFSAEYYCWPDKHLSNQYPNKFPNLPKYLNSGGFIGTKANIWTLIKNDVVNDTDDDQRYWTQKYLNQFNNNDDDEGDEIHIVLDHWSHLFQTLGGVAANEVVIKSNANIVKNNKTNTEPCIIHGNGDINIKLKLNAMENYLGNNWSYIYEYIDSYKILNNQNISQHNNIFIALFGNEKLFENIKKELLDLNPGWNNLCVKYYGSARTATSGQQSIDDFIKSDMDVEYNYYFTWEYDIIDINCVEFLKKLAHRIDIKCDVIAPLLKKPNEAWSNFWGAIDNNGWYKRSEDYFSIINSERKGVWNVPYITSAFMISRKCILQNLDLYQFNGVGDIDMTVCECLRRRGWFMYVDNLINWGSWLTQSRNIDIQNISDVQLFDYMNDNSHILNLWEKKYLHPLLLEHRNNVNTVIQEVCNDAFVFPLFNKTFCQEVIQLVEKNNKWSKGGDSHYDPRINNQENYPTQDIHLKDINPLFDQIWRKLIKNLFSNLISQIYSPYSTKGLNIAFIVKYSVDGQKELAPHHDASTYTLNISLNEHNVDYEGGGCYFVRQKYAHIGQEPGYCCVHPGKLTHYHQGLTTTKGTRYILVSFID